MLGNKIKQETYYGKAIKHIIKQEKAKGVSTKKLPQHPKTLNPGF